MNNKVSIAVLLGGTAIWGVLGSYLLGNSAVITALAVVLLTSLLKKTTWSDKVKFTLTTAVTIVAGAVTVVISQGWDNLLTYDLPTTFAAVMAAAQVYYRLILNGTTLEDILRNSLVKPKPDELSV